MEGKINIPDTDAFKGFTRLDQINKSVSRGEKQTGNRHLRQRDYLRPDEVKDMVGVAKKLSTVTGGRDAAFILMSYRHGLRIQEACNLKWSQVDWANARLHVKRQKGSLDGVHPLQTDTMRMLKKLSRSNKQKVFVFESMQGNSPDPSGMRKIILRCGVAAGISFPVNPHALRHGCGYFMINQGYDIRYVQQYLGHKSIANTVRYTQLNAKPFENLWD